MEQGTVKSYDPDRGYGFIDRGGQDVFVHFTDLGEGADGLAVGDAVEFELIWSRSGPKAVNVRRAGLRPDA